MREYKMYCIVKNLTDKNLSLTKIEHDSIMFGFFNLVINKRGRQLLSNIIFIWRGQMRLQMPQWALIDSNDRRAPRRNSLRNHIYQ
ncbi:hypothetical protein CTI14_04475 [Methylobacterium radiotolerans]|nr:hypothetical protein CTI14_04475 [Methylobacterium radiotolerans]